jgi:hypothetical protein
VSATVGAGNPGPVLGERNQATELRHTVTATSINFLLLAAVVFAWALGAFLQWRNIRHQEQVLANLERLRLRVSRKAAREKAPPLVISTERDERMTQASFPLAG